MQPHSFTVNLFSLLTARQDCADTLENKTIALEYNYYSGYHISSSTMLLTWPVEGVVDYKWDVSKCGQGQLCLASSQGTLAVDTSNGRQYRVPAMVRAGQVQAENMVEVLCEDCKKREHCNIVNRGQREEETGRMMADSKGRVLFGYNYGHSYQEWFEWTVKFIH